MLPPCIARVGHNWMRWSASQLEENTTYDAVTRVYTTVKTPVQFRECRICGVLETRTVNRTEVEEK